MRQTLTIAGKELRDGLRNRWVAAAILLLAGLALALALVGSAPVGTVKATSLSVTVASLASLSVYLVPLIALMLSHDAVIGEVERGTLPLLLAYPVARWQVILGKFLGHVGILALALAAGYGGAGLVIGSVSETTDADAVALVSLVASSILLGAVFVALGYLISVTVRERATSVGLAVGLWLVMIVLYDLALIGVLIADQSHLIGQDTLAALMMLNPADAFRMFNLQQADSVRAIVGLSGAGAIDPRLPLAAMAGWTVVAGTAAFVLFRRKEL